MPAPIELIWAFIGLLLTRNRVLGIYWVLFRVLGCADGWLLRWCHGWNLWLLAVCAVCSRFTRSA